MPIDLDALLERLHLRLLRLEEEFRRGFKGSHRLLFAVGGVSVWVSRRWRWGARVIRNRFSTMRHLALCAGPVSFLVYLGRERRAAAMVLPEHAKEANALPR